MANWNRSIRKEPETVTRLYTESGLSKAEIARLYSCSTTLVTAVLKEQNIPFQEHRGRNSVSRKDDEKRRAAKLLRANGFTFAEIGSVLGVSRQRAQQLTV